MKRFLLLLFFLMTGVIARAQVYRTYLNDDGKIVKPEKAKSYVVFTQMTDTAWTMKQYDMHDTLIVVGTYKDRNLKIANGTFYYYGRMHAVKGMKNLTRLDTINHVIGSGTYKNGVKNGYWIDYFSNGQTRQSFYYKNGKLNGPSEFYRPEAFSIIVRGNYVNDTREGEWELFDLKGKVVQKETYVHGELKKMWVDKKSYRFAKPPAEFYGFIDKGIKAFAGHSLPGRVVVSFTIATDGTLKEPAIVRKEYNNDNFDKQLLSLLLNSPRWTPATQGNEQKPMEDYSMISIDMDTTNDVVLTTQLENEIRKISFYNLTR
ncbi:MAG TPA: hypothetical protein VK668_01235 [Mucilaginibacter sp.]|nr:hypothetical protein [Mucilaginibacter sp.]